MENKQWKTGDVVWLKSGGPRMTVRVKESEGETIICDWFESMTPKVGSYLADQLTDENPSTGNPPNSSGREFRGRGGRGGPSDQDIAQHRGGRAPFDRDFDGRGGRGPHFQGFAGRGGHGPSSHHFEGRGHGPADNLRNALYNPMYHRG
jgi:uncharacterized protein YodC (DUF2158 family)